MQSKVKNRNNGYLLITISDKQCTRHFKIPKYLKSVVLAGGAVISLALVVSNVLVFTQKQALNESHIQAASMEDAFVKLSSKNSSLYKSLAMNNAERTRISDVLADMEKTSGVSTSMNAPILERLNSVSDYFSSKAVNLDETNDRMGMLKQSIALEDTSAEPEITTMEPLEPISLNINQQKLLHDSIPNGYPNQDQGIISAFGKRINPTTSEASFHNGVDLRAPEGTQIYATADGIIKQANYNKLSGKNIVLSHNYGFETRYAHLSKMQVGVGDVVQKGDFIGLSGNTGRSDGPHLHYEIRYLDKPHNPDDFLDWEFGSQEIFTKVRGIQWQSLISLINKQVSRPTLQLSQLAPE